MRLDEKINSLTMEDSVREIQMLLSQEYTLSISETLEGLISIKQYESSVKINDVAKKYLNSQAFSRMANLDEKVACYQLWDNFEFIYSKIEKKLQKNQHYSQLVEFRENRHQGHYDYTSTFLNKDGEESLRNEVLCFTQNRFQELFTGEKPIEEYSLGNSEICAIASYEMVLAALQRT